MHRKQAQAVTYQWQMQDPFPMCKLNPAKDYWHNWIWTKPGRTNHKSATSPVTPEVPTLHLPEKILIMSLLAISILNRIIKLYIDSPCRAAKSQIIWRTFAQLFRIINQILLTLLVWRPRKEIREAGHCYLPAPKIWREIYKSSNLKIWPYKISRKLWAKTK